MHKVTFDGLQGVSGCITEWASFLEYHTAALRHCWDQVKKLRFNARATDRLTTVKEYMTSFSEFMRCDIVFNILCSEMILYDEEERKKNDDNVVYQPRYPFQ